ncbi:hypothetical protein Lsan_0929 [Legionella santicrucis]|uniref:Uncharacterized protein n=1 Tax=Legionella santicrucis TaxID=45074 RepID=A0A0W0Z503_9GAMM|nr:hypothetical protein [Legionella santicrucis]KTD64234.1 hypothetical protein Lsan_0929 [Legionella santicrucis]
MGIKNPYIRTCRQFTDGSYANSGKAVYIKHPSFAQDAAHYVRAFHLIQKDLLNLFDYIEPSDINLDTYSFRVHELLFRTCVEVEANFKAILRENGYNKKGKWDIKDYMKVNKSHFLSDYEIILPNWHGIQKTTKPFELFKDEKSPDWYKAYNATKHDRHHEFQEANFKNLIGAVTGLLALLSSQFYTHDFSSGNTFLVMENSPNDDTEAGIGEYFRVRFPKLPIEECYDFEYKDIQQPNFSFDRYTYSQ